MPVHIKNKINTFLPITKAYSKTNSRVITPDWPEPAVKAAAIEVSMSSPCYSALNSDFEAASKAGFTYFANPQKQGFGASVETNGHPEGRMVLWMDFTSGWRNSAISTAGPAAIHFAAAKVTTTPAAAFIIAKVAGSVAITNRSRDCFVAAAVVASRTRPDPPVTLQAAEIKYIIIFKLFK